MASGRGRSRRVSLPGVAELLRPATPGPDGGELRLASGREKHSQKITVYLSAEELLDLERARLALLRYGAAADRGRIVREAIAVLLADLDARGKDSLLARRIVSAYASANAMPAPTGTGPARTTSAGRSSARTPNPRASRSQPPASLPAVTKLPVPTKPATTLSAVSPLPATTRLPS